MGFAPNPELQKVKDMWDAGHTTGEIGRALFPHMKRPAAYAADVLKRKWDINLKRANRRRKPFVYSAEEKAKWKSMRPYMSVMEIVRRRRAAGVRLLYAAVHSTTQDIKGPTEVKCLTQAQKLEARRLYQTYGWHLLDIAARFGKAESTMRKHCQPLDDFRNAARDRQPNYLVHAPMADIARECLKRAA